MEQLLVLAVVLLILLLSFGTRWIRGTNRERGSLDSEPKKARLPPRARTRERKPEEPVPSRRQASTAPLPAATAARSRTLTLKEARRGIVLMTVLGPCRGLEGEASRKDQ